jgi:hypothetical protein
MGVLDKLLEYGPVVGMAAGNELDVPTASQYEAVALGKPLEVMPLDIRSKAVPLV